MSNRKTTRRGFLREIIAAGAVGAVGGGVVGNRVVEKQAAARAKPVGVPQPKLFPGNEDEAPKQEGPTLEERLEGIAGGAASGAVGVPAVYYVAKGLAGMHASHDPHSQSLDEDPNERWRQWHERNREDRDQGNSQNER